MLRSCCARMQTIYACSRCSLLCMKAPAWSQAVLVCALAMLLLAQHTLN